MNDGGIGVDLLTSYYLGLVPSSAGLTNEYLVEYSFFFFHIFLSFEISGNVENPCSVSMKKITVL